MTGFAKASDLEFHIRTDWKHAHKIWENLYKEGSPITALLPIHQLDGTKHTVSGLTAGHVLTALTPTTFGFAAPVGGDIPAHQLDGAKHTVSGLTGGHFLKALTPTTFGFAAHGLTYSDVGAAAAGHDHSGVYDPAGTGHTEASAHVTAHEGAYAHGNIAHGETAYGWGNHAGLYSLLAHNHSGVYEPVIAGGTSAQYWRGDKSWQTLNQAAVDGLKTTQGPEFAHIHLTDLAAIYTAAESWIGPSATAGIYFKGGKRGMGTATPAANLEVSGGATEIRVSDTGVNWAGYSMSTSAGIAYFVVDNSAGNAFGSGSPYALVLYTGYVGDIVFMPQGAEALRFKGSTGKIGINDSNPGEQLDVGGGINTTTHYHVADLQVVGARGAAVADSTDAASVILRLNDLLARCRAHGLIAT